jgi:medium-chain acyl-[acyl-carrier-protein] hydrolase
VNTAHDKTVDTTLNRHLLAPAASSAWFPQPVAENAGMVLYWLPHSGGSAKRVAAWQDQFGERVALCPVELPGRGTRASEPAYTRMMPLVHDLAAAIMAHHPDLPWAIGGHSLGALTAWETTRTIRDLGGGQPRCLILSQSCAPQLITPDIPPISTRTDDELARHLGTLGGVSTTVLSSKAAMRMIAATFRPDAAIRDHWHFRPGTPLTVPIIAFAATDDPRVSVEQISGWRAQTSGGFAVHTLPGNHFALYDDPTSPARSAITRALTVEVNS